MVIRALATHPVATKTVGISSITFGSVVGIVALFVTAFFAAVYISTTYYPFSDLAAIISFKSTVIGLSVGSVIVISAGGITATGIVLLVLLEKGKALKPLEMPYHHREPTAPSQEEVELQGKLLMPK